MSNRVIVLASRNKDKVRELKDLVADLPFEIKSAEDYPGLPDVIEDGTTAIGNATRKAVITAAYCGEIAIADDTALRVEALGGMPDIFAARFSGSDATYSSNCDLLFEMMRDVPSDMRQALFITSAVLVDPTPSKEINAPAGSRWLHNPFARSVEFRFPERENDFWEQFQSRKMQWEQFHSEGMEPVVTPGVDAQKLQKIFNEMCQPMLSGNRPAGEDPLSMRLPDPRIWLAKGPCDLSEPTHICPSGLPADAPGRANNRMHWFEMSSFGRVLGEIAQKPRGSKGFGYDPLFKPYGSDRTMAEMSGLEKNKISHRGRAVRRLCVNLRDYF
ncbi:hypothetical protein HN388_05930 [bacterium]|jgi:non-canonical purine NTP pyrophosphatase (RdgB/HAM1 family)|nr:hypothetical protein [bacterium]